MLVVDETGYLPISRSGAMLFFQLMTRRYEHASTSFEEWGDIFGDESWRPRSSGVPDKLRLVPSSTCQIFQAAELSDFRPSLTILPMVE